MKIAFASIMSAFPWGGSEELWSQTASWLARQGHSVSASVVYWPQPRPQLQKLRDEGISIQVRQSKTFLARRALQYMKLLKPINQSQLLFRKWLLQNQPDLVCLSEGGVGHIAELALVCIDHKIPFITIGQSNSDLWWPDAKLSETLRYVFKSARACFFVSQANLQLFEKQIASALDRASVVRNPFKVDYDAHPPWPNISDHESWQLACVARLDSRDKGQDLLLEVLTQKKWRDRPLQVSLVGAGPHEEPLKQLVAYYQLESTVKFAGHVSNIEKVWQFHHALVLPSRKEGLPLALVECMLCQRPAIVTDVAGNAEVLDDGETGFLAESATVKHIDRALERAWNHKQNWRIMGQLAGERIRQRVPQDPVADFGQQLLEIARRIG